MTVQVFSRCPCVPETYGVALKESGATHCGTGCFRTGGRMLIRDRKIFTVRLEQDLFVMNIFDDVVLITKYVPPWMKWYVHELVCRSDLLKKLLT